MTNWAKLIEQGRCKGYGIPWNDEELKAVYEFKIPVEFVRQGCLTVEDYKKFTTKQELATDKDQKVPLVSLKKNQLMVLCREYGIEVTPEANRAALIEQLLLKGAPKRVPLSSIPEAED